jgi:gliding motility-associated-like protein
MKKIFLSLLLLLTAGLTQAQITIGQSDMPNTNDTIRISVRNSLSNFSSGATGANYFWDYSNLIPDSQRVVKFVSPLSTPYIFFLSSSYGEKNFTPDAFPFSLLGTPPTDVYNFYKETSTYFAMTGQGLTVSGAALPAIYFSNDILYRFPLNYLNVDSSNSGFAFPLPNIGFYAKKQFRKNTVDGWGTLKTPFGTFQTLRVKSELEIVDSIHIDTLGFGFNIPRQKIYEFKWLANGKDIPVLQIDATEGLGGGLTIDRVNWQDSIIPPLNLSLISQSSCPIVNEGSITSIISGGRHPLKYLWSNGDTTANITNLAPGDYTLTVTDLYGQTITLSDSVKTRNDSTCLMWLEFVSTKTCPSKNEGSIIATQFGGRTPVTYLWNTGDTSAAISNLLPGQYTLTVTDKYGRQVSAVAIVEGNIADVNCLNIPNAFTPDGDGTNDVWNIRSLNEFQDCKVEIFNSWGSLMFSSKGYDTPWDGKYNGTWAPAGTYYYVIQLGNNQDKFTGTVTIVK